MFDRPIDFQGTDPSTSAQLTTDGYEEPNGPITESLNQAGPPPTFFERALLRTNCTRFDTLLQMTALFGAMITENSVNPGRLEDNPVSEKNTYGDVADARAQFGSSLREIC